MKTIIVSNVITDTVCLIVIAVLWRQIRNRFAGTGFFVLDFALQTTAFFLIVLRGNIPDWLSIVLSNTLVIAGAILGYMGLLRFTGKISSQIHNYILLVVFAFMHAYLTFWQPNLAARNVNVAMGLLIICFQCAWLLLYRVEPGTRQLTRSVGIVFCFYCLVSSIRVAENAFNKPAAIDFFQSRVFDQFILISHQMLFVLLTFSLIMMFNKRLLMDVRGEEEKFFKAFHSSPYAIMITRVSDGKVIEVNSSFFNITGYQLADLREKTTLDLRLWNKDEDRSSIVNELTSKGKVLNRELQFRKKSGEMITGIFSAELLTTNNEKCVLSSINIITERKQAEEALRESEDRYKSLLSNIPDIIFTIDLEGIITFVNQRAQEVLGYESAEMGNRNILNFIPQEDRQRAMEKMQKGMSGEKITHFQTPMIKKSGEVVFFDCSFSRVYRDGALIGAQGTAVDITYRKLADDEISLLNAELEQKVLHRTNDLRDSQLALLNLVDDMSISAKVIASTNKTLEAANKEIESFSYSVSHDLRAPLRSIDGFSQILLEDYKKNLDDTGRNYLERIRKATQNMGQLIDDMLKLSRVTSANLRLEPLDLSNMFREIIEKSQENDPARIADIIIQEGIIIDGDPTLMHIALTNLIENAWKFTGKEARTKIEFGSTSQAEKKVIFIRDNGVGFDMAYVDKLFGTFQRLHTTAEFQGTGIGLATVKRIITRHGGEIWAEGEVGCGATFYFTLPE
ncbi:MAG: PAS domain S-box protein [Deltaproteobacteria bacterium]